MSYPSRTVVPGGAVLPLAAVTRVGVRADRTRRGLATALMRAQLDDLRARGDVLALLWAIESGIYGRYGYGVATRARAVRVRASRAALRPQAPAGGTVRVLDRAEFVPVLSAVHDTLALRRPGGITRTPGWWEAYADRPSTTRCWRPCTPTRTGRRRVRGGRRTRGPGTRSPAQTAAGTHCTSRTCTPPTPHAAAGLWRFLLGVDLIAPRRGGRAGGRPAGPAARRPARRGGHRRGRRDWLRLVDVPAALAARSFGAGAAPVLLAVHDPLLADNAGVYRIAGEGAERVGPLGACEPELSCGVAALAPAYLGDRSPSTLAATGWWTVHDPAAPARADALFTTAPAPWCGTHF